MPETTTKKLISFTKDTFTNFMARLGLGADNQISASHYYYGPFLTRNRQELEAMYRNSWIVGQVVDTIAEDMTRAKAEIVSEMNPDDIDKINRSFGKYNIWGSLCDTIKWARLFGGGLAILMIEGQDPTSPLDIKRVRPGSFKGLLVLDRWLVQPPMGDLVTELGPQFGMPKYYDIIGDSSGLPRLRIHYSRVIRLDGIRLPYYQKYYENTWGESVVERLQDRLIAFDSASHGAAQLIYKAHLRGIGVEGLREVLSMGGKAEEAVIKQFDYIRLMQSNECLTLLDSKDQFWSQQYTFSGLSDMMLQFGMQISGATGIPLVRLFGQSPAGLNSTGESDLRNYYDHINKLQENQLRPGLEIIYKIMAVSEAGIVLPDQFDFTFNSLWQMSDKEKADLSKADSDSITTAYNAGLISRKLALQEMRQSSRYTGRFTNITDEVIAAASDDIEPKGELFGFKSGSDENDKTPGKTSLDRALEEALEDKRIEKRLRIAA